MPPETGPRRPPGAASGPRAPLRPRSSSRSCGRSSTATAPASSRARGIEPPQCAIVASISARSTSASGVPTSRLDRMVRGRLRHRRAGTGSAATALACRRRRDLRRAERRSPPAASTPSTSGPSWSTTMLRTTLSSCRTFPGHGRVVRIARTSGSKPAKLLPSSAAIGDEARLGDRDDVLGPRPQRRHVDRHDVQPVEEVLAEAPRPHLLGRIAVGRADDAHVDRDRPRRADRLDRRGLQEAQELGLQRQVHLADLVEEQRPAVRHRRRPRLVRERAGEGALADGRIPPTRAGRAGSRRSSAARRASSPAPTTAWIARAQTSLPVPLSPVMNTVAVERPIERTIR